MYVHVCVDRELGSMRIRKRGRLGIRWFMGETKVIPKTRIQRAQKCGISNQNSSGHGAPCRDHIAHPSGKAQRVTLR